MQIAVVGLGYVGLVTAACLARLGQQVLGLDSDRAKLAMLAGGDAPFYEPGLQGELRQNLDRLAFSAEPAEVLRDADCILICVGTPSAASGEADLTAVMAVADTIADHVQRRAVVALRSTVPVGTTRRVEERLNARLRARGAGFEVPIIANPEFLRTGRAVEDFLHPARVVMGRTDRATDAEIDLLTALYRPLDAPILVLDAESAELVKNAANTYLATRISFVNELAALCERTGASITSVLSGVAADPRIGGDYLRPGLGYGGSCLPKDVRSFIAMGARHGEPMPLSSAVHEVNARQVSRVAERLAAALGGSLAGRRIAILGLAFKPDTDDIRESPAIALARLLGAAGADVVACDPEAAVAAAEAEPSIRTARTPLEAATDADAVVLATEWPAYVTADLSALAGVMRGTVLFDGRAALDPERVTESGLAYLALGVPSGAPS